MVMKIASIVNLVPKSPMRELLNWLDKRPGNMIADFEWVEESKEWFIKLVHVDGWETAGKNRDYGKAIRTALEQMNEARPRDFKPRKGTAYCKFHAE